MKIKLNEMPAEKIHINKLANIAKNNFILELLLILFVAIGLTACGGGSSSTTSDPGNITPDNNNTKTLLSIDITPPNPLVGLGLTNQLKATGHYSDGTTEDITSQVNWYSADTRVVTINNVGLATGLTTGRSSISAKDTTTSFESKVYITVVDKIVQAGSSKGLVVSSGIATDKFGNIYITGSTDKGLSDNTQQKGKADYFIAKYNPNGILQWVKQDGADDALVRAWGINVDTQNNVYIVGTTNKGLGGNPQHGFTDYFIAKYDGDGNFQWLQQVGTAPYGMTFAHGVTSDTENNIYIVGTTNIAISGQSGQGSKDYFVAKYNTDGTLLWTKEVGSSSGKQRTEGYGISIDNKLHSIYVTGTTDANLTGENVNLANNNYFLAQYTESALNWTKQVSAAGNQNLYSYGVKVDNNSNVNIVGVAKSSLLNGKRQDIVTNYFIAQYDSKGGLNWTTQVGAQSGRTQGYAISTDDSGNIYVAGTTNKELPGAVQSGKFDSFLAMYDINGKLQSTQQIGAVNGYTTNSGVTVDFKGHVYTTGVTSVGLSQESQQGITDYFIIKYK